MAKAPLRIADALGFGGGPKPYVSPYLREVSKIKPGQKLPGTITRAPRPSAATQLAQLLTPNTRFGNELAAKIAPAVEMSPLSLLTGLVDARRAYQAGNTANAAGLGILAALGAVPGGNVASKIDDVIRFAEDAGVKLYLSKRGGNVAVNLIEVPKEMRSTGIGSDIMNRLSSVADDEGLKLTLTPDASRGATSVGRLKDFYKRFGFIENKGKAKDFEISDAMYREPRI